ncbi:hypothetical protein [Blastopirellula marina]|uniref:Uncharacterized protein n=1 Tax=Blastopirellula marina TaxID=124 RepID=A0A2S8FXU6_9BACT|nr:hypothetical protein [Blastopirellula marina]PQO36664.1 hypothetical protein C5Y98_11770 [Blastopirellula marina]PTL44494.1 hypothetical protein C5Y97_11780 [Blastopirellula marina]
MSHYVAPTAIVCGLILLGSLQAADPVQGEQAALNYEYGGVYIGMPLEEFKRLPRERISIVSVNQELDLKTYSYAEPNGFPLAVEFYKSTAYRMIMIMKDQQLSRVGGESIIEQKLIDTFGDPHAGQNDKGYVWKYPNIHRMVGFVKQPSQIAIIISDTTAEAQINQDKANRLDLGF